ncbi:hypothetical protein ACFLXI_01245 [Chloroflexota bacterium]
MFRRQILSVATLSAATLLLETTLTRLLAVAQFYHFAFLVISLALLGFGASGTLLSMFPRLREMPLERMLTFLGIGFLFSVGLAYGVVNLLPFDSYSIAWDRRQILLFVLYYLVLTLPFIISGLGVGSALTKGDRKSHIFYAANLIGSSVGALLAPLALHLAGVPGAVLLCAILGLVVSLLTIKQDKSWALEQKWFHSLLIVLFIGGMIIFMILTSLNLMSRAPLGMAISPYKGLAQALRYPDAEIVFNRWNVVSRVDMVTGSGTHQMPGLSYLYPDVPPDQIGLSLDAGTLQAVTLINPDDFDAASYLPESVSFEIFPEAQVLVLEPEGGLGVLQALAGGAAHVTAVVDNPLIPEAIASASMDKNIYSHQKVHTIYQSNREYLQQKDGLFDIIFLPLTDTFQPVSSGAYSLSEDYSLTVEAFEMVLSRLKPDGIFVFTRWMQVPPSESLRAVALIVEALEQSGDMAAEETLVIYRGIQTVTVIVRPAGWSQNLLATVRKFTQDRKFDLVWIPGIQESEVNRFNLLPKPSIYLAVRELLTTQDRAGYYNQYPYDISPPSDDNPFFFHFFTWEQTSEVLSTLGHIWQPFGGSGYFVLLALLLFTIILSFVLILFPMKWIRAERKGTPTRMWAVLIYFSLLGVAFMFIEIPLIQRWILLLGHPTYAFTIVVTSLLCFSGFGSALSRAVWLPRRATLSLLLLFALVMPLLISKLSSVLLNLPLWGRLILSTLSLAPMGILMGFPFPLGVAWLEGRAKAWIPLAWAVNGCSSVIASVLAAILSLSFGFTFVLLIGAGAYAGAAALYMGVMKDQ